MKNRLDEVFSLERLHRAWGKGATSAREPSSPGEEGTQPPESPLFLAAQASYRRLRRSVERHLPVSSSEAFEPLFLDLEKLLIQRFPPDPQAAIPRDERTKTTLAVDGLLNQIEDLVEAFELGSPR